MLFELPITMACRFSHGLSFPLQVYTVNSLYSHYLFYKSLHLNTDWATTEPPLLGEICTFVCTRFSHRLYSSQQITHTSRVFFLYIMKVLSGLPEAIPLTGVRAGIQTHQLSPKLDLQDYTGWSLPSPSSGQLCGRAETEGRVSSV